MSGDEIKLAPGYESPLSGGVGDSERLGTSSPQSTVTPGAEDLYLFRTPRDPGSGIVSTALGSLPHPEPETI